MSAGAPPGRVSTVATARLGAVTGALLGALLAAGAACAEPPVALVLETSGSVVPLVRAFHELAPETSLRLAGDARVILLHYWTCRTITLVGGRVTVSPRAYSVAPGTSASEAATPCPRRVTVRTAPELSGATLRGFQRVRLGTRPAFVIVGPGADDFASVRISRAGAEVLHESLHDRAFRWPAAAPPLESGSTYELVFLARGADDRAASVTFVTVSPATEELVLMSVD